MTKLINETIAKLSCECVGYSILGALNLFYLKYVIHQLDYYIDPGKFPFVFYFSILAPFLTSLGLLLIFIYMNHTFKSFKLSHLLVIISSILYTLNYIWSSANKEILDADGISFFGDNYIKFLGGTISLWVATFVIHTLLTRLTAKKEYEINEA